MIDSVHNKKPRQKQARKVVLKRTSRRKTVRAVAWRKAEAKPVAVAKAMPKKKKIGKNKMNYAERKKAEKEMERHEKTEGNLLKQLTMIHERQKKMDTDKDHYVLVDVQQDVKNKRYRFMMVKDNEPYVLKIDIKENYETVCNCFDWRIRCRNFMIPCKHIAYTLTKILGYELFEYYDNKIMKPELFEKLVKEKIIDKKQFKKDVNAKLDDKMCAVCFCDCKGYNVHNTVECPDCANVKHLDCARVWLQHSVRKVCAICASQKWKGVVDRK
jgi:hypothetical protein